MSVTSEHAIELLHQHPEWLAINKPVGIGMHSDDGEAGLVVQCEQQFQQKLWPVHRLDKVTSGILLLARSAEAAAKLGQLFEQHQIQKYYLAKASGKPAKKQGLIKGDMVKTRNGCWKLTRSQDNPAVTRFVSHFDESSGQRGYLLAPKTGRTHQLRVALKSLGTAIDGDTRYKGAPASRTFLHAYAVVFEYNGAPHRLLCAPSETEHWAALPDAWQSPWNLL